MDNMQVQGPPMGQEEQTEREEIGKAQAEGVVDFNKKSEPEKSLNYTHKFAKPTEIMGRKYESLTFYFEELSLIHI